MGALPPFLILQTNEGKNKDKGRPPRRSRLGLEPGDRVAGCAFIGAAGKTQDLDSGRLDARKDSEL